MNIEGAIFDMDGTILDSMYIWETIGSDYLKSRGIQPQEGLDERFKDMSMVQAARCYQEEYGLTDSVEKLIEDVNRMIKGFYEHTARIKPGVKLLLQRLREQNVPMCVATATDIYLAEAALRRSGILHFFDKIFTCSEVGAGKESPLIFEQALTLMGTQKGNTVVFEDALYSIQTAKRAGFFVAAVCDQSAKGDAKAIQGIADIYVPDLNEEILSLIEREDSRRKKA